MAVTSSPATNTFFTFCRLRERLQSLQGGGQSPTLFRNPRINRRFNFSLYCQQLIEIHRADEFNCIKLFHHQTQKLTQRTP